MEESKVESGIKKRMENTVNNIFHAKNLNCQ